MGDQSVARSVTAHRTAQTQYKRTQTSMPQMGFEPTIPVFVRTKTVRGLDREATVKKYLFPVIPLVLGICCLATGVLYRAIT
jgi:hypothetical protein